MTPYINWYQGLGLILFGLALALLIMLVLAYSERGLFWLYWFIGIYCGIGILNVLVTGWIVGWNMTWQGALIILVLWPLSMWR